MQKRITQIYYRPDSRISQEGVVTSIWTSDKPRPHADQAIPFDWMESNIASDEWGIEVMVALNVLVHVANEFLKDKETVFRQAYYTIEIDED